MRKSSVLLALLFIIPTLIFSKPSKWKISAPLKEATYGHSAVSDGGKIFVMGGFSLKKRKFISGVYMFHPLSGTWRKISSMRHARVFAGSVHHDGKIYVIGGNNKQQSLNYVEIYDVSSGTWSYGAPMPTSRRGFATAVYNGKIYCAGGFSLESRATLKTVEVYDIKNNSWEKLPDLPFPRQGAAAVAANGRVYIIGGVIGTSKSKSGPVFLRDMNYYVVNTKSWHKGPSLIYNRYYLSAIYHKKKIYAIGGIKGLRPIDKVEMLDLDNSNKWVSVPGMDLSTPRNATASVILSGMIYTIGGLGYNGALNTMEVLRVE